LKNSGFAIRVKKAYAGKYNPKIKDYKFWQDGLHPIEPNTAKFIEQKINYIHQNPVEACVVFRAEGYVLSSAAQYAGEYNALLEVTLIEDLYTGLANNRKF
jgi:putative transposase